MSYQPKPIDTSGVTLSGDISWLTERLAEHVHDVWAQERLRLGWTHGAHQDDGKRQHPCLVPYAQLPDSEKQLDRNTAIETLKAIVALGYRIEKR
ncbi:MAG TPA: RyR domain-containing protein [Vicinamibacterales bacterium]|jgi:ryanodine receptor 2